MSEASVVLSQRFSSTTLQTLDEADLAALDQPLNILLEPEPRTKLGQQVLRLEQQGLNKAAQAVKACGRVAELWTYACDRSAVGTIVRSHRRYCCVWCDRYLATRLFDEHRVYRRRLQSGAALFRITIWSSYRPISREGISQFENTYVAAIRELFKDSQGWGFKAMTHYINGYLVAEGMIAVPRGMSLPPNLSIANATCSFGLERLPYAFDEMLSEILMPKLKEGHGILRADLMAAFQGGNHFRSLGIFYGLVSQQRLERNRENLRLSSTTSGSGAGSEGERPEGRVRPAPPTCPFCGPSCPRVRVTTEPLSVLNDIPRFEDRKSWAWERMKKLQPKKYHVVRTQ